MNEATHFVSSPVAGRLVVGIVACFTLAALGAVYVAGLVEQARRDQKALRLRAQRRALHPAALRATPVLVEMRGLRLPERGLGDREDAAARARRLGVDEMQLDEDFAGFAEMGEVRWTAGQS